jgi:hypothetical protein
MFADNNIDFYAGIFCFNPLDDPYHMERISNNISSICKAAKISKSRIKLVVSMNKSNIALLDLCGTGEKTENLIKKIQSEYGFDIIEYTGVNANSRGYNQLLMHGHQKTDAKKIVIFADDYIMPFFWFDMMSINFKKHKDAYFIMPCTSYVAQKNLEMNIEEHPDWDIRVADKGDHKKWNYKTIYGGVKIEHINEIAKKFVKNNLINYSDPPSFETTVFKRELIDTVGYIHDEYFSCFYDNDYFKTIEKNKLSGMIARNCFIFHYGKGGTKALYKETADEKFKDSPVEHQLNKDIETWNKRWGHNIEPWWGNK